MNRERIENFLSNKSNYPESKDVADYLENDVTALDDLDIFEHISEAEFIRATDLEKRRLLHQIIKPQRAAIRILQWASTAAAILLVGWFTYYWMNKKVDQAPTYQIVQLSNDTEYSKVYYFPDSSYVQLAPGASVSYRTDYSNRRVIDQGAGKAIYAVRKDAMHPFRVWMDGVETKALGTVFSVEQKGNDELLIALLEGKIVVEDLARSKMGQVFLKPGETIRVNTKAYEYTLSVVKMIDRNVLWDRKRSESKNTATYGRVEWSNTAVNFVKMDNSELFGIIEQMYGVTIIVKGNQILQGNFTGSLYRGDDIEVLMNNFCQLNGCQFTLKNNVIELKDAAEGGVMKK
jgi:hypothetical protein